MTELQDQQATARLRHERALIRRINRQLAKESKQLKIARGDRQRAVLGDYFVMYVGHGDLGTAITWPLDGRERSIVAHHVNPEELGEYLGLT